MKKVNGFQLHPLHDVLIVKKAILECQKHNDYQESIRWLFGVFEEYGGHGRHIAGLGKEAGGTVLSVCHVFESIATTTDLFFRTE
jgi:hypothetical protein